MIFHHNTLKPKIKVLNLQRDLVRKTYRNTFAHE